MCYLLFFFLSFVSQKLHSFSDDSLKIIDFPRFQPHYLNELISYRAQIFCGSGAHTKGANKKRNFKIELQYGKEFPPVTTET